MHALGVEAAVHRRAPAQEAVALLKGGFGNQLFQLAAALETLGASDVKRVTLLSYGNEWGADHPSIESMLGLPVHYPSRTFRVRYPGVSIRESWKDSISMRLASIIGPARGIQLVRQVSPYDPKPELHGRTLVLDGFFQDRSWWSRSWPEVAALINERRPLSMDEHRDLDRVAVKIRRSDYLGRGIALVENYYEKALDALDVHDCPVTVVCEEPGYIDRFAVLLASRGCTAIEPVTITGNINVDHFWNLATASRQILANSSYCWWAAAVAAMRGTGRAVAYPDPWLPDSWGTQVLPDMGLPGWVRIPANFE